MKYYFRIDTAIVSEFTSPTHEKAITKAEKLLTEHTLATCGYRAKLLWVYRHGQSTIKEWGKTTMGKWVGIDASDKPL